MQLVFCSLSCWDAHQADARHRDAGAEETKSPSAAAWARELAERQKADAKDDDAKGEMRRVTGQAAPDLLAVASKLKEYIQNRAQMSTADRVLGFLSDHLRKLCD